MKSNPEHTAIIDLLLEDRYEDAAEEMKNHLNKAKQGSFDALIKNGGWNQQGEKFPAEIM